MPQELSHLDFKNSIGHGVGGHCIPIDPIYFKWIANNKDLATKMIDVAREINENMPKYVLNRALQLLDDKDGKDILMVGVAYKKNVNDARNRQLWIL